MTRQRQTVLKAAMQLNMFEPCPSLRFEILADHAVRNMPDRAPRAHKPRALLAMHFVSARTMEGVRERRRIAADVVDQGGNVSDFAQRVGIASQTASTWLRNHATGLHRQLLDQPHPNCMSSRQRLARLLAVQAGDDLGLPRKEIAARLTLSSNRLDVWLNEWAPDGLADAIELEQVSLTDDDWCAIDEVRAYG